MLANFGSSADGSGNNTTGTTSVVGGVDTAGGSAANSAGMTTANGDQKEGESKRQPIPYSMPGVLHYLQHEWNFYEFERAKWENERAELKARISFLMGERKAQENLKHDLVRRIKMLEYALKKERIKFRQFTENDGQQNGEIGNNADDADEQNQAAMNASKSTVPFDIDAVVPPTNLAHNNNAEVQNLEWAKARETLRQYLQEIGYTDKILDVRSFRVKSLLGLLPENTPKSGIEGSADRALAESEQAVLEAADAIKQHRMKSSHQQQPMLQNSNKRGGAEAEEDSDSSSGGDGEADLDADAVEAINEFSFLKKAMDCSGKEMAAKGGNEPTKVGPFFSSIQESKKQQQKRQPNIIQGKQNSKDEQFIGSKFGVPSSLRNISVDTVHGMPPNTVQQSAEQQIYEEEKFEGIKAGFGEDEDDQTQRWTIRYTLRSHYDSIRAMQFHPVEPVLITASEDGTAKLWDLNNSSVNAKSGNEGSSGGKTSSQFPQPATGIVDIEPLYTFRGHSGPILAMDLSPLGENCYTAGLDGIICCWNVPSVAGLDIYQNFDRNILQERLVGHTDAIWSLCFHSSSNRLISASSDGTIKIWIVGLADGAMPSPLLKTITEIGRPHSIDLVSTESQHLLSACAHAKCHIRDFETGQIVTQFQMNENNGDDGPPGEINKILSHPTMPVTITAGEDRKIRFFDNNTGKLINSTMAHVEGVSTLAIESSGLYMLSASHDGSIRLWNAEKQICLQEIAAHRKKSGSGVTTVAFHPSRQLIGSAGADSLAKVYGKVRSSPRGSLIASASPPSSSGSSGASSLVGSPQKHQPTASSQL